MIKLLVSHLSRIIAIDFEGSITARNSVDADDTEGMDLKDYLAKAGYKNLVLIPDEDFDSMITKYFSYPK